MRKADDDAEIVSDWKFAAMVVDRSVSVSDNKWEISSAFYSHRRSRKRGTNCFEFIFHC